MTQDNHSQSLPQTASRMEACGTIEETLAVLGLAALHANGETASSIARIQSDLLGLVADLSSEDSSPQITNVQPDRLESEIDEMNKHLQPLRSFVLPGGSPLAAAFHHARTVCRRTERRMFALAAGEHVEIQALRYLNRLSDWFFVAARMANNKGADDVLWTPAENAL